MKFNHLSIMMSVYWAAVGIFCGFMSFSAYQRDDFAISAFVASCSIFLLYGAIRLFLREKPYTWKREHPFWLFMTKEERREDFKKEFGGRNDC